MSSLTLTIDRSSLGLADLVIPNAPGGAYWLPEDGVGRPAFTWRRTYAPESPWLHGSTLVAAVKEQASIPTSIYVGGSSTSELRSRMSDLEDALSQFTYDATLTEDGVAATWAADPADYSWGDYDSGMAAAFIARATVTIPVYPIPGA